MPAGFSLAFAAGGSGTSSAAWCSAADPREGVEVPEPEVKGLPAAHREAGQCRAFGAEADAEVADAHQRPF
jgi:hypothetical protein